MHSIAVSALFALAAPNVACADGILGCWMHDAERLTVAADHVVMSDGVQVPAKVIGSSAFFVAPKGERNAGDQIVFTEILDGRAARGAYEADTLKSMAEVEYWTPCDVAPTS